MGEDDRIITIDGPAGAGKSTLARALAQRLNYIYLDTGAMYRAVALAADEAGVDVRDEEAMGQVVADLDIHVTPGRSGTRIFLGAREITDDIRQPHISALASTASALAVVRKAMLVLQRQMGKGGRVVAEGRDMGTVVFPKAGIKFYLFATLDERARRRFLELQVKGQPDTLEQVQRDMEKRDTADSSRALAPLKPAPDAVLLDSTRLSPERVLAEMLETVNIRLGIGEAKEILEK